MSTRPAANGNPRAHAGHKSVKRLLADHCADAHGVWLTTKEYQRASLHDVAKLDPCRKVLVGP